MPYWSWLNLWLWPWKKHSDSGLVWIFYLFFTQSFWKCSFVRFEPKGRKTIPVHIFRECTTYRCFYIRKQIHVWLWLFDIFVLLLLIVTPDKIIFICLCHYAFWAAIFCHFIGLTMFIAENSCVVFIIQLMIWLAFGIVWVLDTRGQ